MDLTKPVTEEISGAKMVARFLVDHKVKFVFGYPGGAVLPIYDELSLQTKVKHILVRHEQAAVHAADAFARCTDEVGVSLVTSGPGVTNAVTGIATAHMDSVPMVIISGQVPSHAIGQDAFQEVDAVGITRPCVKHNFLVKNTDEIPMVLQKAFYIAKTGRPGPVLVDIPKDITQKIGKYFYPTNIKMRSYNPIIKGHSGQIKKAFDLLIKSKRPMVYTGGGIIFGNASDVLKEFVETLNLPCTNTLMGLGGFPGSHSNFLGMLGMHGNYEANMAMQDSDVLIAIGARFDDRVIGNPENFKNNSRKIIHIDIDPSSISKRVDVDVPIVGDVKQVLSILLKLVKESKVSNNIDEWWSQINKWREKDCLKYKNSEKIIKPQLVVQKLYEATKSLDTFITSDVGQHQMWAAQFYKFDKPKRWINSGGLGTMGVGLPYAMGVQLAHPNATVICVTGEASIQMCIQELSTAKQYNMPLKIVNLNNRYMGMVRQWQEFFHENRYAESYMEALPDFVALAESYGHVGFKIENPHDIDRVIKESLKVKDRLVFMDFITDQTENVYPMIPGGKGLSEMILV